MAEEEKTKKKKKPKAEGDSEEKKKDKKKKKDKDTDQEEDVTKGKEKKKKAKKNESELGATSQPNMEENQEAEGDDKPLPEVNEASSLDNIIDGETRDLEDENQNVKKSPSKSLHSESNLQEVQVKDEHQEEEIRPQTPAKILEHEVTEDNSPKEDVKIQSTQPIATENQVIQGTEEQPVNNQAVHGSPEKPPKKSTGMYKSIDSDDQSSESDDNVICHCACCPCCICSCLKSINQVRTKKKLARRKTSRRRKNYWDEFSLTRSQQLDLLNAHKLASLSNQLRPSQAPRYPYSHF